MLRTQGRHPYLLGYEKVSPFDAFPKLRDMPLRITCQKQLAMGLPVTAITIEVLKYAAFVHVWARGTSYQ